MQGGNQKSLLKSGDLRERQKAATVTDHKVCLAKLMDSRPTALLETVDPFLY